MATNVVYVANPTPADVVVNAQTAKSLKVTKLTITDTLTDLDAFVAKGCIVAPAAMANGTASVTDVLDNLTSLVQKGSNLMLDLVRAEQSAGSDVQAQAGL
jgi:hypothetical protein